MQMQGNNEFVVKKNRDKMNTLFMGRNRICTKSELLYCGKVAQKISRFLSSLIDQHHVISYLCFFLCELTSWQACASKMCLT